MLFFHLFLFQMMNSANPLNRSPDQVTAPLRVTVSPRDSLARIGELSGRSARGGVVGSHNAAHGKEWTGALNFGGAGVLGGGRRHCMNTEHRNIRIAKREATHC